MNKAINSPGAVRMAMTTALLLSLLVLMIAGPAREGSARNNSGGDMPTDLNGPLVKISFGPDELFIRMHDNPTSRDFLKLLPLSLTLEDYNRTEKISTLPRKLATQDAPGGCDPSVGDFTYYAPWGNLAIFYRDFRYSNGLIILGRIESGVEKLAMERGDFDVRLELVE